MNKFYFVKSRITGGHYAFKTDKSSKPFENPMNYYRKLKLRNSDIVADIGAYVGEYSLIAVKSGVKKVYSYEPTPDTFELLKMNKKPNMEVINMAVVGDNSKVVNLYLSKGIGVTNSIAKHDGKRDLIKVPAIKYENALMDATVVKIDVEGAEYEYNIIQPNLRGIIIEFHPLVDKPWRQMAEQIMEKIENAGFKTIFRPPFKCGWDLTGCWEK